MFEVFNFYLIEFPNRVATPVLSPRSEKIDGSADEIEAIAVLPSSSGTTSQRARTILDEDDTDEVGGVDVVGTTSQWRRVSATSACTISRTISDCSEDGKGGDYNVPLRHDSERMRRRTSSDTGSLVPEAPSRGSSQNCKCDGNAVFSP